MASLYVASSEDQSPPYDFAADAQRLYDATGGAAKRLVLVGGSAHGVALPAGSPAIRALLEQFVRDPAALAGRLAQMAESQNATQNTIVERLQTQERVVIKAVDERLQGFSKQVGDKLTDSTTKHQTALAELRERLVVIDKAQQSLTELSTQVVGLQDILANKQARGAFGEIQLRDLVEATLPPSAYAFQATLGNGRRADCLLNLPNPPGPIAIDS